MAPPIPWPARIDLARTPTPLESLPALSAELGVQLLVKRDDLTGTPLSGNKVRKLEYLLADAQARGCDTLITGGGSGSNHCRATAVVAARHGLQCHLLLRVDDPQQPPAPQGNLLLSRLVGAHVRWIDGEQWTNRRVVFQQVAAELQAAGRRPYVIPEGGSNATGSWGYVRAVAELRDQLDDGPWTLVHASGSGGTGAGLAAGIRMFDLPWRAVAINVCDDEAYFLRVTGGIVQEMLRGMDLPTRDGPDFEVIDGYVGRGYAKSRPEELALIGRLARDQGLLLDPVYTGKAMFGLVSELRRDPAALGERIVFLHTGGVFGLFAAADALTKTLL